jgi:hypothetical protein
MAAFTCTKCGSEMDAGFVLDKAVGESYAAAPEWAEGVPERSFWTGIKMRGRERHPVVTYRCVACGYLESFAPAQ